MRAQSITKVREAMIKVAKILAGKGVTITQIGDQPYVSYTRSGSVESVNLPVLPDNASETLIHATHGFLDHEIGHVMFTDYEWLNMSEKLNCKNLWNILEDTYVERMMIMEFKGAAVNISRSSAIFTEKYVEPKFRALVKEGETEEAEYWSILAVAAIRAISGQEHFIDYMNAGDKWQYIAKIKAVIELYTVKIQNIISSSDSCEVAVDMKKALLGEKAPPSPEGNSKDDSKGDSKGDSDDSSSGDSDDSSEDDSEGDPKDDSEDDPESEDNAEDEPEGESKDESDEPEDEPEDNAEDEPEGESKDESDEPEDESKDESDEPEDESKDESDEPEDESKDESDEPEDGSRDDELEDDSDSDDDLEGDSSGLGDDELSEDEEGSSSGDPSDDSSDDSSESGSSEGTETGEMTAGGGFNPVMSENDIEMIKGQDEATKEIVKQMCVSETSGSSYTVLSRDFDEVRPPVVSPHYDPKESGRIDEQVDSMIGVLARGLERAFIANNRTRWESGKKSGRLNSASLSKLLTNDVRVMKTKEEMRTKDVAVSLLVDCSGSMSGSRIEVAMRSAWALTRVLTRLKINCEVLGFTTMHGSSKRSSALEKYHKNSIGSASHFDRRTPIYIPVFKAFSEPFASEQKARMTTLLDSGQLRTNIDGESVQYALERLQKQPEPGKTLIVLSDGQPSGESENCNKLSIHLKKVVQDATKAGINMVGIGIQSNAVKSYYPKHVSLNKLEDLPEQVMAQLRAAILSK